MATVCAVGKQTEFPLFKVGCSAMRKNVDMMQCSTMHHSSPVANVIFDIPMKLKEKGAICTHGTPACTSKEIVLVCALL